MYVYDCVCVYGHVHVYKDVCTLILFCDFVNVPII